MNQSINSPVFRFDPLIYVNPGAEKAPCDSMDLELQKNLSDIRNNYPELSEWGDLAVMTAWGDYSQQVHLVSWVYFGLDQRDETFLYFLCWQQTRGDCPWGIDPDQLKQANGWCHSDDNI